MTGGIERDGGPGGLAVALIALALLVGLILVASVFHFRRSWEKPDEERAAVRRYFVAFFALLLALPCGLAILVSPRPGETLEAIGWTLGRSGLGLTLTLTGLPLAVLSGFVGSRDDDMRRFYPLAKAAFADVRTFARYEISYVFLYYLPYEFVFRGVLFLPLIPAIGQSIAAHICLICNAKKMCVNKTGVCTACYDTVLTAEEKKVADEEAKHKTIKIVVTDDRWEK